MMEKNGAQFRMDLIRVLLLSSVFRVAFVDARFACWNKEFLHLKTLGSRSSQHHASDDYFEQVQQQMIGNNNGHCMNSVRQQNMSPTRRRRWSDIPTNRNRNRNRNSPSAQTQMVSLEQQIQVQALPNENSNSVSASSMNESVWLPWPFNLFIKRKSNVYNSISAYKEQQSDENHSGAQLVFTYFQQKARGGFQQMQQMGNALSFHLPPAAPPLLLLALLPTKLKPLETVVDATTEAVATASSKLQLSTYLPNTIAKRLSLLSLGISVVCWADYEVRKKKRLTPIPLFFSTTPKSTDIQRAVLPPFLPEELPPIELDPVLGNMNNDSEIEVADVSVPELEDDHLLFDANGNFDMNIPGLRRSINKISKAATPKPERFSRMIKSWQKMMRVKQRDDLELKRRKTIEKLLVLQQLKKKEREKQGLLRKSKLYAGVSHVHNPWGASSGSNVTAEDAVVVNPLGYALVTGASRGIGRSLAVELARWEIPLILVARDKDKLLSVANEIKGAYGVECCVIPADLNEAGTAKRLHKATTDAGLKVDLLINNAGVYHTGNLVDGNEDDFNSMINVNVGSVTNLSYLYGKDMKKQRRGRILFVSSVVGATPGGPGVATYAATKAYEKSLAQSMGREMEKYGVGVTCVLPGAVKGTSFANGSTGQAVCWKFPFYPMSSRSIAERSIHALLSGDAEVIPGWHNRLFLKIVSPLMPQRLITSVCGFSFSPLKLGIPNLPWKTVKPSENDSSSTDRNRSLNKKPPLLLALPDLEKSSRAKLWAPKESEPMDDPEKDVDGAIQNYIDGNQLGTEYSDSDTILLKEATEGDSIDEKEINEPS